MVEFDDRPKSCIALNCEDYTPCKKCGRNLNLREDGKCKYCSNILGADPEDLKPIPVISAEDSETANSFDIPGFDPAVLAAFSNQANTEQEPEVEDYRQSSEITQPGTPLSSYNESEKNYYNFQWKQYSGYYRDPTAYAMVHQLILLEIELFWVNNAISNVPKNKDNQEAITKQYEDRRTRILANLATLRKQLPEKESQELSDDEKSLGMIYESYLRELGKEQIGSLRRVLTPEAIVLAEVLPFKVDVKSLLRRSGFLPVEIETAMEHIKDTPKDFHDYALFFGFPLDEKYSMPIDENIMSTPDADESEDVISLLEA